MPAVAGQAGGHSAPSGASQNRGVKAPKIPRHGCQTEHAKIKLRPVWPSPDVYRRLAIRPSIR
eukprot:11212614-Lingulodinium_polyedra.AAC.1